MYLKLFLSLTFLVTTLFCFSPSSVAGQFLPMDQSPFYIGTTEYRLNEEQVALNREWAFLQNWLSQPENEQIRKDLIAHFSNRVEFFYQFEGKYLLKRYLRQFLETPNSIEEFISPDLLVQTRLKDFFKVTLSLFCNENPDVPNCNTQDIVLRKVQWLRNSLFKIYSEFNNLKDSTVGTYSFDRLVFFSEIYGDIFSKMYEENDSEFFREVAKNLAKESSTLSLTGFKENLIISLNLIKSLRISGNRIASFDSLDPVKVKTVYIFFEQLDQFEEKLSVLDLLSDQGVEDPVDSLRLGKLPPPLFRVLSEEHGPLLPSPSPIFAGTFTSNAMVLHSRGVLEALLMSDSSDSENSSTDDSDDQSSDSDEESLSIGKIIEKISTEKIVNLKLNFSKKLKNQPKLRIIISDYMRQLNSLSRSQLLDVKRVLEYKNRVRASMSTSALKAVSLAPDPKFTGYLWDRDRLIEELWSYVAPVLTSKQRLSQIQNNFPHDFKTYYFIREDKLLKKVDSDLFEIELRLEQSKRTHPRLIDEIKLNWLKSLSSLSFRDLQLTLESKKRGVDLH